MTDLATAAIAGQSRSYLDRTNDEHVTLPAGARLHYENLAAKVASMRTTFVSLSATETKRDDAIALLAQVESHARAARVALGRDRGRG